MRIATIGLLATIALIPSIALAQTAPPAYGLSGWSAAPGGTDVFTFTRADSSARQVFTAQTNDDTAKVGVDYEGENLTFVLDKGVSTKKIPVDVYASPTGITGTTLHFGLTISLNGTLVTNAGSGIIEPAPVNQTCWDGSVILATAACPVDNPLVGQAPGVGAPDIPTKDHDVLDDLQPSWGTGAIPAYNAPYPIGDVRNFGQQGAFRFICRHTNLANDDPTVFPGKPGASHLHDQTGVYGWNAFSTYGILRVSGGGSGCNDVAGADKDPAKTNHAANRTPYWQAALLDGKGHVILADYTSFYYKRAPDGQPEVSDPTYAKYMGKGVPLPNGIKFLFGADPMNPTAPHPKFVWSCVTPQGGPVTGYSGVAFSLALQCVKDHNGPTGAGYQLNGHASAPDCWDGVHLDVPDHRSHLAYPQDTHLGYSKCDPGHPFVIPTFTYAADYTILSTDDGYIHFSSDEMDPTQPAGWSFHVDYGPASWDPVVLKMWMDNCINKMLNCSGGDLGNGKQLKGAQQPIYVSGGVYTKAWRNPQRLVDIPPPATK